MLFGALGVFSLTRFFRKHSRHNFNTFMTQRATACAFCRMVREVVNRVKLESLSLGFITVLLISWCEKNVA